MEKLIQEKQSFKKHNNKVNITKNSLSCIKYINTIYFKNYK